MGIKEFQYVSRGVAEELLGYPSKVGDAFSLRVPRGYNDMPYSVIRTFELVEYDSGHDWWIIEDTGVWKFV